MAHKKVLNPKQDFWEVKKTTRKNDIEALEMAKQIERKKTSKNNQN